MIEDLPDLPTEVTVSTVANNLNSISEKRAKRLLDRIKRGESLSDATRAERMSVAEVKDPHNPVRASIQQLIGQYFLPPEARKQLVRAGLNKVFIENVQSYDPAAIKLALDAAKQIGADPEVGLTTHETGGVIINIGELAGVFDQIQVSRPPEVDDGRGQREDTILEADYEDLPERGGEPVPVPELSGRREPGVEAAEFSGGGEPDVRVAGRHDDEGPGESSAGPGEG